MKAQIHPKFFDAKVVCTCGNAFTVGSTLEVIHIELCNKCHPFYTGAQRFVDSASRIERFQKIKATAADYAKRVQVTKEEKKAKANQPKSLSEMLAALK